MVPENSLRIQEGLDETPSLILRILQLINLTVKMASKN
jgi:hypothetical protein